MLSRLTVPISHHGSTGNVTSLAGNLETCTRKNSARDSETLAPGTYKAIKYSRLVFLRQKPNPVRARRGLHVRFLRRSLNEAHNIRQFPVPPRRPGPLSLASPRTQSPAPWQQRMSDIGRGNRGQVAGRCYRSWCDVLAFRFVHLSTF
jgi:hypothetical protein